MNRKKMLIIFLFSFIVYYWIRPHLSKPAPIAKLFPNKGLNKTIKLGANSIESRKKSTPTPISKNPLLSNNGNFLNANMQLQEKDFKSRDAVPFINHHGMAVAYGDVLIGALNDNISKGYAKSPDVNYWPNSTIHYHIQPNIQNPERILKAFNYLSEKTVLNFIPYEDGIMDAIVFEPTDKNCLSYIGRITGTQPIFISPECEWYHIVHEILHAVGLIHEHSRPDRNRYITIDWSNIPEIYHSQFEILPETLVRDWLKYDYDIHSIMHYGSQILKEEHKGTSLHLINGGDIPEPTELSIIDIQKINDLFQGRN